ncbi:MAG TPA: APC family permease [Gemmatimonadaceae bacterium]|nr:APC family permease [Gemmatimonadaceae bacterium]
MKLRRQLGTLGLVFILFFCTSGGAFTTETLVASVGPGLALAVLVAVPLLWSLPEVLLVGELASMLPEEGGYYRWVRRAFGPFWAFQNAWLTWMYSLVDMALYPVLFNQYLAYFVPGLGAGTRWAVSLAMIWAATAMNLRGARPVGRFSVVTGSFIVLGFLALAAAAVPHVSHAPWVPFLKGGQGTLGAIGVGLSLALWNYTGWDNGSTVQGEVTDASRTYPRALAFGLPLVMLGYLVPLTATLGASDWTAWREGGWPEIALASAGAAGPFLAVWIALAGLVSAVALFNALLLAYSRVPLAMADDGLLPAFLARTDARGTPVNAVLASAVCYSIFALAPLQGLVVADVFLYALALFLEFGALVRLRVREPHLRGAFRIPLGTAGVAALAALPVAILSVVLWLETQDAEFGLPAVMGSLVAIALGPAAYRLARRYVAKGARG